MRREYGAHVSLGIGDKPTLDLMHDRPLGGGDPHVAMLREAGAAELARPWGDSAGAPSRTCRVWGYPDTWLEDDHPIAVGDRTLDAVATPGHTQGHFVFADPAAGLLFAGDHVLPTITPSIGFEPVPAAAGARRLPGLPDQGARRCPTCACCPPTGRWRRRRTPGSTSCSPTTTCGSRCASRDRRRRLTAYEVAGGLTWTRHEHRLAELDTFNPRWRSSRPGPTSSCWSPAARSPPAWSTAWTSTWRTSAA